MKMLVRREQRKGFMGGIIFALDVRLEMSPEEEALMHKYNLGDQVIYDRKAVPNHTGEAISDTLKSMLASAMSLTVTAFDLCRGKRFECKNILEMMSAESQVRSAAHNFALMLEAAAKFGGEEVVPIGAEAVS